MAENAEFLLPITSCGQWIQILLIILVSSRIYYGLELRSSPDTSLCFVIIICQYWESPILSYLLTSIYLFVGNISGYIELQWLSPSLLHFDGVLQLIESEPVLLSWVYAHAQEFIHDDFNYSPVVENRNPFASETLGVVIGEEVLADGNWWEALDGVLVLAEQKLRVKAELEAPLVLRSHFDFPLLLVRHKLQLLQVPILH